MIRLVETSAVSSRVVPFSDIAIGQSFRALRNDNIKGRIVENNGFYAKVGNGCAIDITSGVDVIFHMRMPCRVIGNKFDVTDNATYKACHAGQPV